jgi:hypothetical protein
VTVPNPNNTPETSNQQRAIHPSQFDHETPFESEQEEGMNDRRHSGQQPLFMLQAGQLIGIKRQQYVASRQVDDVKDRHLKCLRLLLTTKIVGKGKGWEGKRAWVAYPVILCEYLASDHE